MKNKTKCFAVATAVLLTLCLVFMMPVGAATPTVTINGNSATSLQDALNSATDGAEIVVDGGEITELIYTDKPVSITIKGKNNPVLRGGMSLTDFTKSGKTISVEGITFDGAGLVITGYQKVNVENNVFNSIAKKVSVENTGNNDQNQKSSSNGFSAITVRPLVTTGGDTTICGNIIDGTNDYGISVMYSRNVTIEGNTIKNPMKNSIHVDESAEYSAGKISISGNTLINWATGKKEGRALRLDTHTTGTKVFFNNNILKSKESPEEFVKITGVATDIDVSQNYWNGADPVLSTTTGKKSYYLLGDGVGTMDLIKSYYTDYTESGLTTLVKYTDAVAQIGETTYYSLQAAVNAVPDNSKEATTITVLKDISSVSFEIPVNKKVVLDLNGHTIYGIYSNNGASAVITNNGELTIDGSGKITTEVASPDTDWDSDNPSDSFPSYANNAISNKGVLIINSGTIECRSLGHSACYVVDVYAGGSVTVNGGVLYNENNVAIRIFTSSNNPVSVTINNGATITGKRAIWIQLAGSDVNTAPKVELKISGGTLTSNDKDGDNLAIYSYSYGNSFANTKITITNGIFNGNIQLTGGSTANNKNPQETVIVSGGEFNGHIFSWADDQNGNYDGMAAFITGGVFTKNVDTIDEYNENYQFLNTYVVDTHEAVLSGGKYVVKEEGSFTSGISVENVGFDSVKVGYTQPIAKTVTVKNTGNMDLTLKEITSKNFVIGDPSADGKLVYGAEPLTFTIQPKENLPVGNYAETITVTTEEGAETTFEVSFLVYQPSSGGSSKPVEEPVEPEIPEEPEVPTEEPVAGEVTVETEVTDGGEVEFEAPVEEPEAGEVGTPAAEDEAKITGVVLPTGTEGKVEFVPVSEQAAPEGKETQTKKVFEINVPTYEKGKPATIKFTMTVAELAADGKEAADVALWHFDEETGEWTKLVTSYTIVDGVVYFEAITNDFSPFAIVYEDEPVNEPVEEPETPASPAPVLGLIAALGAAVVLRRK